MGTRCQSLPFVVTRSTNRCHLLSLVDISCHQLYHWLSVVVTRITRLSFDKRSSCEGQIKGTLMQI